MGRGLSLRGVLDLRAHMPLGSGLCGHGETQDMCLGVTVTGGPAHIDRSLPPRGSCPWVTVRGAARSISNTTLDSGERP